MKKKLKRITVYILAAGMTFSGTGSMVMAEETAQETVYNGVVGTMAFAQCDEYVNIRSDASTESEVTGKIYNNCAATILGESDGWYEIKSGNAIGYVSADYFATGEAAEEIADQVAYNVAKVHPEALMVRSNPDEASDVVDMAQQSQELEVVEWNGDWMKVALGGNSYGYVNAYYVDYCTYYATAETLEEEQQRLAAQQAYQEQQVAEQEYAEDTYVEEQPSEPTYEERHTQEQLPESTYEEPTYEEPAYEEPTYEEPTYEEPAYEEPTYEEPTYEEPAYEEPTYEEPTYEEPAYEEPTNEEPTYEEPTNEEPTYEEPTYEEPTYEEPTYEEPTYEEPAAGTSGLGQQIADFAVQFVGNPYVYGGTSLTNGADCSGFAQSVFASFGIGLSRTAADQSYGGTSIDIGSIQAGDLLFYSDGGGISHVAIYIGGGQIVHASTEATGICISNYDYSSPVCARRYWS